MRLFISIPLPESVKRDLAKIQKEFSQFPAKWVEEENLHITLFFLGEKDEKEMAKVAKLMDDIAEERESVNLETGNLMLLPDDRKAHVLAAEFTGEANRLVELSERIGKSLSEREIDFDRKPFRPHATLARFKRLRSGEKKKLREMVRSYNLPEVEFEVERIELNESKLAPTGPVYKPLRTSGLLPL